MPLFEYSCRDCDQQFELLLSSTAIEPARCPHCNSDRVAKLISAPCRSANRSTSLPGPSAGCAAKRGFT